MVQNDVIGVVDSLLEKIKANDQTVIEHATIARTTARLTDHIVEVLRRVTSDIESGDGSSDEKLARSLDLLSTLVSSLEVTRREAEDEAIKVESIQEGMRRALMAARLMAAPETKPEDSGSTADEQP